MKHCTDDIKLVNSLIYYIILETALQKKAENNSRLDQRLFLERFVERQRRGRGKPRRAGREGHREQKKENPGHPVRRQAAIGHQASGEGRAGEEEEDQR